jgi:hypothetical protein
LFLKGENIMHLDHTRPISLLWQLDGTGTALCKDCNTKKRVLELEKKMNENDFTVSAMHGEMD